MFRIIRNSGAILAALCLGLAFPHNANAIPSRAKTKEKQIPFVLNGQPLPRAIERMRNDPRTKSLFVPSTTTQQSKASHAGGSLSARENILMPRVKALMAKMSGFTSASHAKSGIHSAATAAITNNTANFPGFQKTPFAAGGLSTDSSATYTSVAADINKDGKQDIVVVQSDGSVNVLLNPGTGDFSDWKITSSNTTAVLNPSVYYIDSQAADVNSDGYVDLEVTDLVNNAEFVYINNKKGGFLDPVEYDFNFSSGAIFNDKGGGVTIADVNGDGIPDMVALALYEDSWSETTVSLITQLGTASGTFGAQLPEQDTVFNGDIVSEYANRTVGDFNNDGKLDLVIPLLGYDSNFNQESFIQVLTGNGDGTFSSFPANFPTTGAILNLNDASYGSHFVADVDGDGNQDVIYSPASLGGLWLAKGNGDGTLQTPIKLLSNLGNLNNGGAPIVNFADVNGDGNIDAIAYNYGYLSVFLNQGKGVFNTVPTAQLASGNGGVTQPLPGDFNNDGKLDLVMVDQTSSHVGFYAGLNGTFSGVATMQPSGETASGLEVLATADFNGDGIVDVVAADTSHEVNISDQPDIIVGTNDGKGNFTYTTAISSAVVASSDINTVYPSSADLNGDGKSDLVIKAYSDTLNSYVLSVALSNGDGTFATPVNLSLGTALSCTLGYVDIGDLNGDGYKDIIVAYEGDANCNAYSPGTAQPGVFVLLNDGKGNFTPSFTAFGYAPQIPKLIDFNGDGKLDLALIDAQDTNGFYYLYVIPGNGDGTFNQATAQYVLESAAATSIIPGDFDGDGIQDLTVGVEAQVDENGAALPSTTGTYLMKGNGDFTFQQPVIYGMGTFSYDGAYVDLNGDGKPDLALSQGTFDGYTDIYTPGFVYYENLGGGALAPGATGFSAIATYGGSIFAADYNGDGAIDVLSVPQVVQGYNDVLSSDLFLNVGGDSLSVAASTSSATQDQSVTLTATVSSTVNTGSPTGTVSFYDNGSLLGASSLSGNSASLSLTTLPVGTDTITAKYSGDSSFNAATASTSVVVTALQPAFTLGTAATATLSLVEGQSGSVSFNLGSNSTFNGSIALTCSGAPKESTCEVFPSSVTMSGAQSMTVTAVVTTTPPNNTSSAKNHALELFGGAGGVSVAGFLMLLFPVRKRNLPRAMMLVLILGLAGGFSLSLTGCGGNGYKYPGTPTGSAVLTVTASSGTITQSQTFTINVSK